MEGFAANDVEPRDVPIATEPGGAPGGSRPGASTDSPAEPPSSRVKISSTWRTLGLSGRP